MINSNGEYLLWIAHSNTWVDDIDKVYLYKTKDFEDYTIEVTDLNTQKYNVALTIDKISKVDGVYYTLLSHKTTNTTCEIAKSVNRINWTTTTINCENGTFPSEASFIKIKDGLFMICRKYEAIKTTSVPLIYSYFTNEDNSWIDFTDFNGITNANASNFTILRAFEDEKNGSGIYMSISNINDVYNGILENGIKIADISASKDSGYPFLVRRGYSYYLVYNDQNNKSANTASIYVCNLEIITSVNNQKKDDIDMMHDFAQLFT